MMQNYISPLAPFSSLNNSIVLNFSVLKRITFGFLLFCCWQTFSHTTKSIFSENKVSIEVGHSPSAVVTPTTGPTHDKYVVGYFAQWAIYTRDFNVSDIEAEHLTHLMYAFYDVKFEDASFQGELAEITWALGAEYKIKNNFSLRSGYYRESVEQGNLRFFSLGTGFEKNGLRLDFSYLINTSTIQNQLQNSLRLSLGVPLNFGIKKNTPNS